MRLLLESVVPKISIIVPIYNGANKLKLLEKNINLLNSSSLNYELIIVDDGSDKNDQNELKKWASQYNHSSTIKFFYLEKNHGPGIARKKGLQESTNEWVAFLDCDDFVDGQILDEILMKYSKNSDIDIIHTEFNIDHSHIKAQSNMNILAITRDSTQAIAEYCKIFLNSKGAFSSGICF